MCLLALTWLSLFKFVDNNFFLCHWQCLCYRLSFPQFSTSHTSLSTLKRLRKLFLFVYLCTCLLVYYLFLSTCTDVTLPFHSLIKTFVFVNDNLSAAIVFSSVSQPPIYLYIHSQDFEIYFFFIVKAFDICSDQRK